MNRNALLALFLGLLFPAVAAAQSHQDVAEIEQYGVYIKGKSGYEPAQVIPQLYSLNHDFSSRLLQLPVVERADQSLEMVIYQPDVHPDFFMVEARSMATPAARSPITPKIQPVSPNLYRLSFDEVAADQIVLINLGCCQRAIYAAALTAPKPALLRLFAKDQDLNPVTAEHILSRIVRGAPNDKELSALHQSWQVKVEQKKATEQYAFIQTVWGRYEKGETPSERFKALEQVKQLCETYLADYAQGLERAEVQRLLKTADGKLKI